jgi:hypothetical protein
LPWSYLVTKMKKIACSKCCLMKYVSLFPNEIVDAEKPVCKRCASEFTSTMTFKGIRPEMKYRKCLKCDQTYLSINDYRLCERCRENNKLHL